MTLRVRKCDHRTSRFGYLVTGDSRVKSARKKYRKYQTQSVLSARLSFVKLGGREDLVYASGIVESMRQRIVVYDVYVRQKKGGIL